MRIYKTIISICLSFIFCISTAIAETAYGDIQLLIKQGQFNEALKLTQDQLSRNASDIKLKFIKGLVLTRLERYQEAESVFIQLTKDNPELPEPFNNLAVVYAAQGEYTKAEQSLRSAINTHPSYATAHENLGDIYAKMASRAYNQALELDTSNNAAREKLSLVNELISEPAGAEKVAAASVPEATPVSPPKPVVKPVPTEPEIITVKVTPEETQVTQEAAKEQAKVEAKVDAEAEFIINRKAVEAALNNWAAAWSDQDVNNYLASYGKEFVPPKKLSRAAWEKERRKRLQRPSFIKVTLSNVKINLHGKDYAEVRFTQSYQSDTYGDKVKKEILMRKTKEKWLITQERTR